MAGPVYYEGQRAQNPNDPNAPSLIYRSGKWVPESAVQNPFAAAQGSQKYADAMAGARAKADLNKLEAATASAGQSGTINANGMQITDDGARILFLNGVRTRFDAPQTKGDANP